MIKKNARKHLFNSMLNIDTNYLYLLYYTIKILYYRQDQEWAQGIIKRKINKIYSLDKYSSKKYRF